MNRAEAAHLLALCSAFDNRTIGDADVLAWADVLADVPFIDAKTAVKAFYGRETRRVMPADVKAGVRLIRRDRLDRADASFRYLGDPDDTDEYARQLAAHRRAIGDGAEPVMPVLERDRPSDRELQSVFRRPPRALEAVREKPSGGAA